MNEPIDHRIFDAGVSADFESVHLSVWDTSAGEFVSDGCALIKRDWCDDTVQDRIRDAEVRTLDSEWWRPRAYVRYTNDPNSPGHVRIRPFYHLELTRAGADLTFRSAHTEALIARDQQNGRLVGLIAGAVTEPYLNLYDTNTEDVELWRWILRRTARTIHPHDLEACALAVTAEKTVRSNYQHRFDMEGTS